LPILAGLRTVWSRHPGRVHGVQRPDAPDEVRPSDRPARRCSAQYDLLQAGRRHQTREVLMRLLDLEPEFLVIETPTSFRLTDDIKGADGVWFLCPKCFAANGNSNIGTHYVICWAPHVPQTISPRPGRWEMLGTGAANLTLRAGSSSVLLTGDGGCKAHFFVKNGAIEM